MALQHGRELRLRGHRRIGIDIKWLDGSRLRVVFVVCCFAMPRPPVFDLVAALLLRDCMAVPPFFECMVVPLLLVRVAGPLLGLCGDT